MAFPNAPGYPNYDHLIEPHLSDKILTRFACESMFTEMTTSSHLDQLRKCGDKIRYMRAPRAVVHPYLLNMKMKSDRLHVDTAVVGDSKGAYYKLKLNDITLQQICNSQELVNMYIMDAMHQFKRLIHLDVLWNMLCNVDAANQGCCAGAMSKCYDLGDTGKCLEIDCDNFFDLFTCFYQVLGEACVLSPGNGTNICGPGGGEPFILLPFKARPVFMAAMSKAGCCLSDTPTPEMTGKLPQMIQDFHVIFSHDVPYYEEDGQICYTIIAGRRDATGFTITMERDKVCEPCDDWAKYYMGLITWASGVIYPEALAAARVTFKWDGGKRK